VNNIIDVAILCMWCGQPYWNETINIDWLNEMKKQCMFNQSHWNICKWMKVYECDMKLCADVSFFVISVMF